MSAVAKHTESKLENKETSDKDYADKFDEMPNLSCERGIARSESEQPRCENVGLLIQTDQQEQWQIFSTDKGPTSKVLICRCHYLCLPAVGSGDSPCCRVEEAESVAR